MLLPCCFCGRETPQKHLQRREAVAKLAGIRFAMPSSPYFTTKPGAP